MPRYKPQPHRLVRRFAPSNPDDIIMPPDKSHDADDESDAVRSPAVDSSAYDTLTGPAVQTFGQDEHDAVEQPASSKNASAWNDVGIEPRQQCASDPDADGKDAPLRTPAGSASRNRSRVVRKSWRVDIAMRRRSLEAAEKRAPGKAASSPERVASSPEPSREEGSSPEPRRGAMRRAPLPLGASRRSISWAELGYEWVELEEGSGQWTPVSLGDAAHVKKRRCKKAGTSRRKVPTPSTDEGDQLEVRPPSVPTRRRRGTRENGSGKKPPALETQSSGVAISVREAGKEASGDKRAKTKANPAKRKHTPASVATSAGRDPRNQGVPVVGRLGSRRSVPMKGSADVGRSLPEEQVGTGNERVVDSLTPKKGEKRKTERRNCNLFQVSPNRSSESDRERSAKRARFPTHIPGKTIDVNKKLEEKIVEKYMSSSPVGTSEKESLSSAEKRLEERKSVNELPNQNSMAAVRAKVSMRALSPDESVGARKSDGHLERVRSANSDVNSEVVKAIEGAACLVCKELGQGDKMVLCDACCAGCHTFCMRPKRRSIPLGVWLCPDCHETAERHEIHISRMMKLRWQLECLECNTRNDPKAKLDCDKACADCRIAFHSECLRRYHKVTTAQLRDPGWKCSVCSSIASGGKPLERTTAKAQEPPTVELATAKAEELLITGRRCPECCGPGISEMVTRPCDLTCTVCNLGFHRKCLLRRNQFTTTEVGAPGWQCRACSKQLAQRKEASQAQRCETVLPLLQNKIREVSHEKVITAFRMEQQQRRASTAVAQTFDSKNIPNRSLLGSNETLDGCDHGVMGGPKTENGIRAIPAKPESSIRTFERLSWNEPMVSLVAGNGDVRTETLHRFLEHDGVEEDVVLDGSDILRTPIVRKFDSMSDGNDASRLDTRRMTSLFRTAESVKNDDSGIFKQRKSLLSQCPNASREPTRRINFNASGRDFGPRKSFGDRKTKAVVRDVMSSTDVPPMSAVGDMTPPDQQGNELHYGYDALGSPSIRDEEILDGGFACE